MIAADDVVVARRLVAGALQTACAPCVAEPVPAMGQVPGDVAPALSQDGVVTIGDAVLALRWAVGLEPPPPIVGRSADVAPLTPAGDAGGDGVVRIDDVVLILRAAVGLSTLQWPERTLTLHVDALGPFVALMGSTAWPSNVAVPRILSSGCDMSVSGIDRTERWTLTCVTDPVSSPASVDLAVLGYRAADPVNADWLTGEAVAVDLALGTLHAELSLR